MSSSLAEKIRLIRQKLGLNQDEFAEQLGITQGTVSRWERGAKPDYQSILAIAKLGKISPDALTGAETLVPSGSTSLDDFAAEHGIVFLEEIDLALGMGATYLDGNPPEVLGLVPFKSDWLRGLFEGSIEHLKVVRGKGDSMKPTIEDGDLVIVDTAHRRIDDQDRIWALAYGDLGMIRRVRVTHNATWKLMPDNSVVRPDEVGDGEAFIMGRVIWIGRRI